MRRYFVIIGEGDIITVIDKAAGSPLYIQEQTGKVPLKLFLPYCTQAENWGGGYKVSGGLHGVGASVVNALSEWLVAQVHKKRQDL